MSGPRRPIYAEVRHTVPTATCPACHEALSIAGTVSVDDWIVCPYCGTDLQVISVWPWELDWAYVEPRAGHQRRRGNRRTTASFPLTGRIGG